MLLANSEKEEGYYAEEADDDEYDDAETRCDAWAGGKGLKGDPLQSQRYRHLLTCYATAVFLRSAQTVGPNERVMREVRAMSPGDAVLAQAQTMTAREARAYADASGIDVERFKSDAIGDVKILAASNRIIVDVRARIAQCAQYLRPA